RSLWRNGERAGDHQTRCACGDNQDSKLRRARTEAHGPKYHARCEARLAPDDDLPPMPPQFCGMQLRTTSAAASGVAARTPPSRGSVSRAPIARCATAAGGACGAKSESPDRISFVA